MIPKYVYEEMQTKAKERLEQAKMEILKSIEKPIEEIGEKYLNEEIKAGRIVFKNRVSLDRYSRDTRYSISVDLRVRTEKSEHELQDQIRAKSVKLLGAVQQKIRKLEAQYEEWQLLLFQKIANGEVLELPVFKA